MRKLNPGFTHTFTKMLGKGKEKKKRENEKEKGWTSGGHVLHCVILYRASHCKVAVLCEMFFKDH